MAADSGAQRSGRRRLPDLTGRPNRFKGWLRKPTVQLWGLGVVTALIVGFLSLEYVRLPQQVLAVGDIAERPIRATRTIAVVDDNATAELRAKAQERQRPVFDHSQDTAAQIDRRVQEAFKALRFTQPSPSQKSEGDEASTVNAGSRNQTELKGVQGDDSAAAEGSLAAEAMATPEHNAQERRAELTAILGVDVPEAVFVELERVKNAEEVEQTIRGAVKGVLADKVIFDRELLPRDMAERGIVVIPRRNGRASDDHKTIFQGVISIDEAKGRVAAAIQKEANEASPALVEAMIGLATAVLQSNLTYNAAETQTRRAEAAHDVPDVTYTIKKGTMIARAGDPIDEQKLAAFNALTTAREDYRGWLTFLAVSAWALLVLTVLFQFAQRFIRKFNPTVRDVTVMAIILTSLLGISRLGMEVAAALSATTPSIPTASYYYLLPIATGAMLVRILLNSETALAFAMALAAFTSLVLDSSLFMAVFFLVSGITAAGGISHTKERLHVLRSGLLTGAVNAGMALTIYMVIATDSSMTELYLGSGKLIFDLVFAFTGGIAAAVMVLGLLPLFEMFGYVTDNKLLELANLNHPLLKEMMVQAPGSYHHSVIVGSLSEAACEAIGANALLARVGCYFHDIGKMKKAQYFIENLRDQENKHDRLAPSMSALIIASHVRDGIELGRRYRLPESIIDLIPQHHGTALISFFFNKAKQMEDLDLNPVDENDYRYPGPRPQSREAGVVMLADATEASTRSIKQPTSAKIRANIQKIFNRVLTDGQLDECPLTLRDLSTIADTFHDVLLGIYHTRIQYPPDYKPKGRRGGGVVPMHSGLSKKLTATQEMTATQDLGRPAVAEAGGGAAPRRRGRGAAGHGEDPGATTTAEIPGGAAPPPKRSTTPPPKKASKT